MMDVIIIGGGKFAGNIVDDFSSHINPLGYIDNTSNTFLRDKYGISFLGNDIEEFVGEKTVCKNAICCVGSEGNVKPKAKSFLQLKNLGFNLPSFIHESAVISKRAVIGEGAIVQSSCIIQTNVTIGSGSVISANSFIGHDSILGDCVFIAPSVSIGGSVIIRENTHVGIGAVVLQKIHIGKNCLIGASSCIVSDIPDNSKVMGVPGKIVKI